MFSRKDRWVCFLSPQNMPHVCLTTSLFCWNNSENWNKWFMTFNTSVTTPSLSRSLGARREYTLDGIPVYHRAPYTHPHTHTHIFTHSFTPRCNLESPIHITAFRGSGNKCTISRNTDDRKDIAYATWLEKRKYGHNHRILFFFPLACMFLRIHSICCVFNAWVDLECVSCELVFYSKCNI